MKKLLALALVALMASGALAQMDPEENMMGMFFALDNYTSETTNIDTAPFVPFVGYVVLLNPTVGSVGGYELGVTVEGPAPIITGIIGQNGWTNFGDNLNHLVGYQTPLPASEMGTVLCEFNLLASAPDPVMIRYGASTPSSFDPPIMGIADGANPEMLIACPPVSYYDPTMEPPYLVATINGDGVVATEAHSLSHVKSLFE